MNFIWKCWLKKVFDLQVAVSKWKIKSWVVLDFPLKFLRWDFPGGPVVKNLPCNARGLDWIPDRGTKIPQSVGQLSPRVTTRESTQQQNILCVATKPRRSQTNIKKKKQKPSHGC